MNKTRKRSTRDLDIETSDYIHLQGAVLSANNDISLDHTGVKQEKIRDGYNENSSTGSSDCSYDQATGIISITEAECEEEVDVGSNDYVNDQVSDTGSLQQKITESNSGRVIYMEVNGDGDCIENISAGSVDCISDQNAGVTSTKGEELNQKSTETSDLKLPAIHPKIFRHEHGRDSISLEKEPVSIDVHSMDGKQLGGDEDEDDEDVDHRNRFYFESDHLALKDNKHYHLLLQSLLVLESQRSQAVKDLDVLYKQQAKALQDPISFVEKLQNNEPLDLPTHHNVVKLPFIPWEEYSISLSTLDKQRLSNPHHTRAATSQNPGKASDSATNSTDGNESASMSSESNLYSVFGGEFVASKHGKPLGRESLTSVFTTRSSDATNGKVVRGRFCDDQKPGTFNQPWTTEEQAKLEKLLQIYPQEEVESKRWEKIAAALGNRTLKQVASRVQKYFIKLAKSGLPVPGRMPNLPRPGVRSKRASHHYQALGFRNSTFFPSYRPKVLMDDEDDASSVATDDTGGYLSDEESVPAHLRDTDDYKELMELKRIKRQKIVEYQQTEERVLHNGFMCDGCGVSPIPGTRWHCNDCSKDNSVDFCNECVERGNVNIGSHSSEHSLEPAKGNSSFFVDGDYVGFSEGATSAGYNYLDPNFLPSAR